jgi:tetratricopeptide (TPR) repeat protein
LNDDLILFDKHLSSIPVEFKDILKMALEKNPDKRYQSIKDLLNNLSKMTGDKSELIEVKNKFKISFLHLKKPVVLLSLLMAIVSISLIYIFWPKENTDLSINRVLVGEFENQTGDKLLDPIGRMAADWITQGLSHTGVVTIVPVTGRSNTDKELQSIHQIHALARETNTRIVVSGSYYKQEENLLIHAQITDVIKDTLLHVFAPFRGPLDKPLQLIEKMRQRVMVALKIIIDFPMVNVDVFGAQLPTFDAYTEFLEGMSLLDRSEYRIAIEYFNSAFNLDSTFYRALYFVAIGHVNIGEYKEADSLYHILKQKRESLSFADRRRLDWLESELKGDEIGELRASRQVAQFDMYFKYQHGLDAFQNNYPQETIDVYTSLDPEGLYLKDWYPYWGIYTNAYHILGDHEQEIKLARRGSKQYPEELAAFWYEARGLAALGKINEINNRIQKCLNLSPKEDLTQGKVMYLVARELRAHGYKRDAQNLCKQAIDWFISRPSGDFRFDLVRTYYLDGQWDNAIKLLESLSTEKPDNIGYIGYTGAIAARQDNRNEAERMSEMLAQMERPHLDGIHIYWQACIASLLGDKERALILLRDSITKGFPYPSLHADIDLEPLLDYPPFKELIRIKDKAQ